jgi:hypothetical protein
MALNLAGSTTHYRISYDVSLSPADGLQRANALVGACEQDYAIMSDWFGGISLPYSLPIEVHIDPGGYASAGWGPPISLKPGNGSGLNVVRYLLVAEVVEMLMLAQNKGWFGSDGSNEGSAGEGLSRVLSAESPHGPPFDPNRGVTFVVNVAWGSPLNICTDVTLLENAPEQVLWVGPRTVSGTAGGTGTPGVGATSFAVGEIPSQTYASPVTYQCDDRGGADRGSPFDCSKGVDDD